MSMTENLAENLPVNTNEHSNVAITLGRIRAFAAALHDGCFYDESETSFGHTEKDESILGMFFQKAQQLGGHEYMPISIPIYLSCIH